MDYKKEENIDGIVVNVTVNLDMDLLSEKIKKLIDQEIMDRVNKMKYQELRK